MAEGAVIAWVALCLLFAGVQAYIAIDLTKQVGLGGEKGLKKVGKLLLIWSVCIIFIYSLCANKILWIYGNNTFNDWRLTSALLVNAMVTITTWYVLVEVRRMNQ